MNEGPSVSRLVVRQDARGSWMVWDRETRRPAQLAGAKSTGLSKEEAQALFRRLQEGSSGQTVSQADGL
jgi:hypothetical protein